jgi:hypothetical protein
LTPSSAWSTTSWAKNASRSVRSARRTTPAEERDDQQRGGRERQRARVRARVGVPQPGEQKRQERGRERGSLSGPALDGRAPLVARRLGVRHRAE